MRGQAFSGHWNMQVLVLVAVVGTQRGFLRDCDPLRIREAECCAEFSARASQEAWHCHHRARDPIYNNDQRTV